ncbi:MAG: hypothetical protein ACLQO1_07700 [Steroidobacteraceae bacterium]
MKRDSAFSSKSTIPGISAVLGFLAVLGGQTWLAAAQAGESANSTPELVRYFVSWHVTEHGSSSAPFENRSADGQLFARAEDAHSMKLEVTGSAIVRYRADNGHHYDTQFLNVTLLHNENSWSHSWHFGPGWGPGGTECITTTRQTNIDPSAYSGFHAYSATSGNMWDLLGQSIDPARLQHDQLQRNLLRVAFYPLWGSMRTNIRETRDSTCSPPESRDFIGFGAPVNYEGYPNTLEADPSAVNGSTKGNKGPESISFSVNRQFTYVRHVVMSLSETRHVTWTAHAYRIGKCFDHHAPIEAGDPIINHEQVDIDADSTEVDPNPNVGADSNVTKARIRVSCEGVPIENAEVLINVDAQDKSGGHIHSDDERPRGTVDGKVVTKVGVDDKKTDAYGQVRIKYGSPLTGVPDHAVYGAYNIGIAGTYKIKAKTTDKFAATGELAIVAKVDGLIALPANYVHCCDNSMHPDGTYGTPTILSEFGSLANAFYETQKAHNMELQNCQKPDWGEPVPVSFNDIALPDGGVFDLDLDWMSPKNGHYTHNRGEGGDFNRFTGISWNGSTAYGPDCNGPPIKRRAWLLHTLMSLGENYGYWDCKDLVLPPHCNPPTSVGSIKFPTEGSEYPHRLHLHVQD